MASRATQAAKEDLARLQKDNAELLRLRNEVGQLRRERDAAQQRANQAAAPPVGSGQSPANPGRYISKDQLAFAGYATPEAALESQFWALATGNYEQAVASYSPELHEHELNDPRSRERFEHDQSEKGTLLKGMQVVARKTLAEDRVELRVKIDIDPALAGGRGPVFIIQPAVRVGNDWKLGSARGYDDKWDPDGQAQSPAQ